MAFAVIFNLALRCFDLLAWPPLALGYPLRASIIAIEKNSDLDMKKLVTYWIIFSLMSLFEHAFVKLLEWMPLWLYIKLMIVCWLVIPHFDDSYYIYMHFVRPCLSMETQTVIMQLKNLKEISFERKDFFLKRENFVDEVEKFFKENGTEALEKLIASKAKFKEDVTQKDIKAVEATKEIKADVAKAAFQTKFKSAEDNITAHAPVEIKEEPSATSMRIEVPVPDQVQEEWASAVPQVTTKSEIALNTHRRRRRRKKKLNAQDQTSEMKVPLASVKNESSLPIVNPENSVASSSEGYNAKLDDNATTSHGRCFICDVEFYSMQHMHTHFKGKAHLSRIAELNGVAGGVHFWEQEY